MRRYAAEQVYLVFTLLGDELMPAEAEREQAETLLTTTAWDGPVTLARERRDALAKLLGVGPRP